MADRSRPIGFWLQLVDRLIDETFAELIEEHGVTRRQWQLLNVLAAGEATLAALDAAVAPFLADDDGETSADHLGELVESEWVVATATGFAMTERGRMVFGKLGAEVAELRDRVARGVAPEAYATTVATLEAMARNLGWDDAAPV